MSEDFSHLSGIAYSIHRKIIEMIFIAGSGHPGGSLSGVEIGTAVFSSLLKDNPKDPQDPEQDRFILSKGHATSLLYSELQESGYFPESWLEHFMGPVSPI